MDDDKDKDDLYTIDLQSNEVGEGMEVIDEEGGIIGVGTVGENAKEVYGGNFELNMEDEDAYGEDEGSEKGDDVIDTGWKDIYEQEV